MDACVFGAETELGIVAESRGRVRPDPTELAAAIVENVEGLVEEDLARKAVALKCAERWDKAAIGEPIRCCDDNGRLVAYMFPVKPNADTFPTDEELFAHARSVEQEHGGRIDWRAETYWTFVVSARETDAPIPVFTNALPAYFVTFQKALDAAKQALDSPAPVLTRYYFLGRRGEYFEFSAADKAVLVHALRIQVVSPEEVLVRKEGLEGERAAENGNLSEERQMEIETYKRQTM